jgi:hypothetical protein
MAYNLKRRRKPPLLQAPAPPSKFTPEFLERKRRELQSGARQSINVGDDRQVGLRAIIRKSGAITFHAMYQLGGSRPMVTIGQYPETSIDLARHLTSVVRGLAEKGIDVQEGLHSRLLQELEDEGLKWRPNRKVDTEALLDRMLHLLQEDGINVPTEAKVRILSELRSSQ